jgi:hypothetical protein
MHFISAQIVRFVDTHQPGWVECEFVDAEDWRHVLRDKVPIFTAELGTVKAIIRREESFRVKSWCDSKTLKGEN